MFKRLSEILAPLATNEARSESKSGFKAKRYSSPSSQGQANENTSFDFLALAKEWPEIVGPRLAQHTRPLKNKFKTLTILTDHGAYSQQLSFMEPYLIDKIVSYFPNLKNSITKLQFLANASYFSTLAQTQQNAQKQIVKEQNQALFHPHSPLYKMMKRKAEELFQSVQDQDLREQLISLYLQAQQKQV